MGFGQNGYCRGRQVGEDIDRGAERHDAPVNQKPDRYDYNDQPVLDRPSNDIVQHSRSSNFVRVGAGIRRAQLLQLELKSALSDNTFAAFDSRYDGELIAIGVADDHVAAF